MPDDQVGSGGVTALTNGNYVVSSPLWDGAAADVGAATWGNGITGIVGVVSAANSLVGGSFDDQVSSSTVTLLSDTILGVTALPVAAGFSAASKTAIIDVGGGKIGDAGSQR